MGGIRKSVPLLPKMERKKSNSLPASRIQRDIWAMQYYPFRVGDKEYKLAELAKVEKGQMPQEVAKENQQYRLCLQYEYIGASEQEISC